MSFIIFLCIIVGFIDGTCRVLWVKNGVKYKDGDVTFGHHYQRSMFWET